MRTGVIAAALGLAVACSCGEPDIRISGVRRAVDIADAGYEPSPDCLLMGSISMAEQDLSSLGSATGGAEVDFVHDLSRKALQMNANLVVPGSGASARVSASSGQAFSGSAYRCPR